jgi:O-acetyl-ADP-ribose deacetylase (regulator of RNase III)
VVARAANPVYGDVRLAPPCTPKKRRIVIREVTGDLLLSKADIMAHGVAPADELDTGLGASMREAFPEMFAAFRDYCRALHPMPGDAWTWSGQGKNGPARIVCLFTQQQALGKGQKPGPATLEAVKHALYNLKKAAKKVNARSVAIPMIGTGAGGLAWKDVKPVVEKQLGDLEIDVLVYTNVQKGVRGG